MTQPFNSEKVQSMEPGMKEWSALPTTPGEVQVFLQELETHKSSSQSHGSGVSLVCDTAQSTLVTKPDLGINEQMSFNPK